MTDHPEEPRCVNCGRVPRPGENPDDDWRAESEDDEAAALFLPLAE